MMFLKVLAGSIGWLGSLFGTKPPGIDTEDAANGTSPERQGPRFAFVCLESADEPDVETLRDALRRWIPLAYGEEVKGGDRSAKDGMSVTSFEVGDATLMVTVANFPIPRKDIEYACANSFLWPEAAEIVPGHTSHLIVIAQGEFESPAHEALALSRAIAACTECYNASAVYWGHANTVHKPEMFRERIEQAGTEMNELPAPMWIGFLRARGKTGGMDVYTSGLGAFGVMEIEVIDTKQNPSQVLGMVSGLAAYLISAGNVIKDGDTVGGDENERVRARHSGSAIGRKEKVLRIEY